MPLQLQQYAQGIPGVGVVFDDENRATGHG
jgi:hypothetical protein